MKTAALCLWAALAVPIALAAPQEPKSPAPTGPPRPETPGRTPSGFRGIAGQVFVGEPAPGFELTSAYDKRVKLSRLKGDRVLLCFADRREMLPQYRAVAESLRADGVLLIGIARDSPRSLRSLAERDSLGYELLSDPTGEIAAMYGSYDFPGSRIRPGYILVGRGSLVRMVLLGQELPAGDLLRITRYALSAL
jgi:peroxiredoxin